MKPYYITQAYLDHFISQAIIEDLGDGDHSSLSTIPADLPGTARLKIKEDGILAGVELAKEIYSHFDASLQMRINLEDGAQVSAGDIAFELYGPVRSILGAERLSLNCMQRMSGIATFTHHLNQLIEGTGARLLDTRKTTPNLRPLEKWAVLIGGGTNHRFALYDMIMLKDNHIDYAGGIANALSSAKEYLAKTGKKLKIEIETRSLDEVQQVIDAGGADVVMLDNMSNQQMREAVALIGKTMQTEASGGITDKSIREVALTGVDFISVGALTHSVKSLDMSLKAEIEK